MTSQCFRHVHTLCIGRCTEFDGDELGITLSVPFSTIRGRLTDGVALRQRVVLYDRWGTAGQPGAYIVYLQAIWPEVCESTAATAEKRNKNNGSGGRF